MYTSDSIYRLLRQQQELGPQRTIKYANPHIQSFTYTGLGKKIQSNLVTLTDTHEVDTPVIPYILRFNNHLNDQKYLAIGDELGYLTILNLNQQQLPDRLSALGTDDVRAAARFQCHQNSIFDIQWMKLDSVIITSSGDSFIKLWDTTTSARLGVLKGHVGSVKTVAVHPVFNDVLVSGGRDNTMLVWDTRVGGLERQPVCSIKDPQKRDWGQQKGQRGRKPRIDKDRGRSVNGLQFIKGGSNIVSAGSFDDSLSVWDFRFPSGEAVSIVENHLSPYHCQQESYIQSQHEYRGTTNLCKDRNGNYLLSSVKSKGHFLYDANRIESGPLKSFEVSGQMSSVGSFYIKADFSPDCTHIVGGSSTARIPIWPIKGRRKEAFLLVEGHNKEVSSVAWCPTDFDILATCSDDSYVNIWKIDYQMKTTFEIMSNLNVDMMIQTPAAVISTPQLSTPRLHPTFDTNENLNYETQVQNIQQQNYNINSALTPSRFVTPMRPPLIDAMSLSTQNIQNQQLSQQRVDEREISCQQDVDNVVVRRYSQNGQCRQQDIQRFDRKKKRRLEKSPTQPSITRFYKKLRLGSLK
eukprot:TRINITY_DN4815_c0_g1_i5.p1 TRINITY_DN4815_c0_g1~~TRINITY_DN4815_c0_g1_i5.p1  ORF type:complete len:601 (-),score=51.81 TRINITY_DN4815_c0_g1_i5:313-2049(-)